MENSLMAGQLAASQEGLSSRALMRNIKCSKLVCILTLVFLQQFFLGYTVRWVITFATITVASSKLH
jgi:hypothetical protein